MSEYSALWIFILHDEKVVVIPVKNVELNKTVYLLINQIENLIHSQYKFKIRSEKELSNKSLF